MGCTGGEIWGTVTALGNASSKERCVGTRAVPFALWMRPRVSKISLQCVGERGVRFRHLFSRSPAANRLPLPFKRPPPFTSFSPARLGLLGLWDTRLLRLHSSSSASTRSSFLSKSMAYERAISMKMKHAAATIARTTLSIDCLRVLAAGHLHVPPLPRPRLYGVCGDVITTARTFIRIPQRVHD